MTENIIKQRNRKEPEILIHFIQQPSHLILTPRGILSFDGGVDHMGNVTWAQMEMLGPTPYLRVDFHVRELMAFSAQKYTRKTEKAEGRRRDKEGDNKKANLRSR